MRKKRTLNARWMEKYQRWQVDARRGEGGRERKTFYNSNPSRRGKTDAENQAYAWIDMGDKTNMRLAVAWELFVADYRTRHEETSANQIESRGRAHLLKNLSTRRMRDMRKSDWQKVIDDAYANGAKALKTLQGIATTITTFCRFCAANDVIDDNQVPREFLYHKNATIGKKQSLQPDELRLVFAAESEDNPYIYMFRFLVVTGLRRGEICALRTHRDYDGQTFTVREAISHEGILKEAKSTYSNRDQVLTGIAKEQITEHQKRFGIGPYVFTDDNGSNVRPRKLGDEWRKWREAHGITLTLHELRHTYTSFINAKTDLSLEQLKKLLGHSKRMDTKRVYAHALEKTPAEQEAERLAAEAAAQKIDLMFETVITYDPGIDVKSDVTERNSTAEAT